MKEKTFFLLKKIVTKEKMSKTSRHKQECHILADKQKRKDNTENTTPMPVHSHYDGRVIINNIFASSCFGEGWEETKEKWSERHIFIVTKLWSAHVNMRLMG